MAMITGIINPVYPRQRIQVFEKGKEIDRIDANMSNYKEKICYLAQKYDTTDIHLFGDSIFLNGVAIRLREYAIQNYNFNEFTITVEGE